MRKRYTIVTAVLGFLLVLAGISPVKALAAGPVASYTAPNGFKVISYTQAWATQDRLKSVYDELLRNAHGAEISLLNRINIYPGADPLGEGAAARWYAAWTTVNGKPQLSSSRYIDLYRGDERTEVSQFARTLAHEYGHHFTYYYYFKQENTAWSNWRRTAFATARGLAKNPLVTAAEDGEHHWLIQEIAAEDYAQLFGSPSAKESFRFADILDRMSNPKEPRYYSTDIYNYHPQENYRLPLAANLPGLKKYWLNAAGMADKTGSPPNQVDVSLEAVKSLHGTDTPQYRFSWTSATADPDAGLEYTLVYFQKPGLAEFSLEPVRTVSGDQPLEAYLGAAARTNLVIWEEIPGGVAYFVVYVKDSQGQITSSRYLAVDFSNKLAPDSVPVPDQAMLGGQWLLPQVKVEDKVVGFDVAPIIVNGRLLVPMRAIFEELGAAVSWDQASGTVTATKGDTVIKLAVGEMTAAKNGIDVQLDVPARIEKGRTLVPLRFISEALGAQVRWNQNLQLAVITD